jgi:VWFA-related protein
MSARRRVVPILLLALAAPAVWAQQTASESPRPSQPAQPAPVFRSGVDVVRVDVIVTDRQGNPVTDLTGEDFEITEDGVPQKLDSLRLIQANGRSTSPETPKEVKSPLDEEIEAAREDVRMFGIFLDEYHVQRGRSTLVIQKSLAQFVQDQIGPNDLVSLADPFTSIYDMRFHRNRQAVAQEIMKFDGRREDYVPRRPMEDLHNAARDTLRVRKEVVLSALLAFVTHMGNIREGRKALLFVSEGFPSYDVMNELQLLIEAANRANVAIYSVDPRGLVSSSFNPGIQLTLGDSDIDTLRLISNQTDGIPFVNRNDLAPAFEQVVRDSSAHYMIGYTSTNQEYDGKFHSIKVRVKRDGVEVRARKGYKALTKAEYTSIVEPKVVPAPPREVLQALTALSDTGRPVRIWIGTSKSPSGSSRVSFSWEPVGRTPVAVGLHVAGADGTIYFKGPAVRETNAASQPGGPPPHGGQTAGVSFDALPGRASLVVELVVGELKQQLAAALVIPDYWSLPMAIDTPRVYRARTAQELKELMSDPEAVPIAGREFARSDRVLIRFGTYTSSDTDPTLSARLLSKDGTALSNLPVSVHPRGEPWSEIDLPLGNVAAGDFLVEITATLEEEKLTELVALRVTR